MRFQELVMDLQISSVIILAIFISMVTSHCFHGNADPTCQFTCHCADDVPCDMINGTCPGDGCDQSSLAPWHGTACQQGNVALGRAAVSSIERVQYASLCTDGNFSNTCYVGNAEGSYWQVDLGDDYAVWFVRVKHPTEDDVLYISLLDKDGQLVERLGKDGNTYFHYKIARFVRITSGHENYTMMNEVVVIGYKYRECVQQADGRFYYGPGCQLPCAEGCAEQCDMITGDGCTVCRPGYQGYGCLEMCRQGYWGDNCVLECDCPECDHVTGECPSS